MTADEFRASLGGSAPPAVSALLQALWHDANGDWRRAHEIVQTDSSALGSRIHAYLHRKEGDLANADYWYRRAREPRPEQTLEAEWEALVSRLLASAPG